MDALLELLLQVLIELFFEFLVDRAVAGLAALLVSRVGRWIVGGVAGFGFGIAWGAHLSGGAHYPRLLWVSLALAVAASGLAVASRGIAGSRSSRDGPSSRAVALAWRALLAPPWRWHRDRLVGLVILNLSLAAGIAVTFRQR